MFLAHGIVNMQASRARNSSDVGEGVQPHTFLTGTRAHKVMTPCNTSALRLEGGRSRHDIPVFLAVRIFRIDRKNDLMSLNESE